MSSGSVRLATRQDIPQVQDLIERCLLLYMNQKEVVETLFYQAKIEPGFTELLWQKLEEDNRDFFRAYHHKLKVKHQINEFNRLLEEHAQLFPPTGVASVPTSNGSHIPSLHQNSACYAPEHTGPAVMPENMHHPTGSSLPNAFTNGGSSLHPSMHTATEMSTHANWIDVPPNTLSAQPSNMDMIQGINGGMIELEPGYSGRSPPEHTGPALMPENMHHPIGSSNAFTNGGSSLHPSMHTAIEMSAHANRIDVPPNMLSDQPSNMDMIQGINGGMIESEPGYSGSSPPKHIGPAVMPENMHHPIGSSNAFTNGRSSLHPSMHTAIEMSAHANRILVPPNMLSAQPSNMDMIQGINGGMIESEPRYSGSFPPEHTEPAVMPENMHHPIGSSNAFTNGGSSSLHPTMHTAIEMSAHANWIDVPLNMLSDQPSNMDMIQGINGGMIESEPEYSGSSPYMFDGFVLEMCPTIGGSSFNSVESDSLPLYEPLLDFETSSFGFLDQIPQNFGLSDPTAAFS